MPGHIFVDITPAPLDANAATLAVSDAANGATALFLGVVRNRNEGRPVTAVTYDVFEELARNTLRDIANEVVRTRGPDVDLYVVHRSGRVEVGEASIVIAAGSPHRAAAFDACRDVIEAVKRRAPIWKREHYADAGGDGEWLAGTPLAKRSDPAGGVDR